MYVSTPTLQMSAGGPTMSPFNISGAFSKPAGIQKKQNVNYRAQRCAQLHP